MLISTVDLKQEVCHSHTVFHKLCVALFFLLFLSQVEANCGFVCGVNMDD